MKCPNCSHDNPDSNKFCSECGSKLQVNPLMIECPNCHNQVPADSKYCPDCGNQLRTDSNSCSTLDEFKSGNIKVYGVTLGLTNRSEFLTNSEFDEHSQLGFYRKNNPRVDYLASRRESPTSDKDFFNQPLNIDEYINECGVTNSIVIFNDAIPQIPFLSRIFNDMTMSDLDMANILEDYNYIRIENLTPQWEDAYWLVSREKNDLGNYVFVMLRGYIEFQQNIVTKCINLRSKKIIKCQ